MLLEYLAAHDVPCPLCGYNLRHLTAPRCPECGREVQFTVAPADPHLRPWIALAVATCLSAGVGLFFLVVIAVSRSLPRNRGAAEFVTLMALLCWFWANIPLAAIALIGRRPFVRFHRVAQLWIATLAWAINVVLFILLAATMFD
jgi:hypothetical protein